MQKRKIGLSLITDKDCAALYGTFVIREALLSTCANILQQLVK